MKWIFATIALILLVGVVSAIPATANSTWYNSTLKSYLPVNASTEDFSGQGHTFTATGATIDTSVKKFGAGSVKFVNTGDRISSADSSDWYFSTKKVSLGGWYKIDATTDTPTLITQSQDGNNEWLLRYLKSTNQLEFYVYSGAYVINARCSYSPSSSFDYIVYTNDGTTQHIYVNGTDMPLTTNVNGGSFPDLSAPLYIGYHPSYGSTYQYKGNIDDWFLYKGEAINGSVVPSREIISNPQAGFMANATSGNTPLTVQITDATLGDTITGYSYRLTNVTGNNTELAPFSTSASPSVVLTAGNWSINQTVTNAFGSSSAYAWINVSGLGIDANFVASNTSGIQPLLVQFADTSTTTDATIDSWAWDFGDGNTSSSQSPSHTYEVPGTYQANLTITNTSLSLVSTKLSTINVYNTPPVANFAISNQTGLPPLVVRFTDTSTGENITQWHWSFGEGNTSTVQNPLHIFESLGEYQVNLTVTNDGGSSTKLQNVSVVTFGADFTASNTSGIQPLFVQFTDTTTGNKVDEWQWDFGDGNTSALQNPSHTYEVPGTYSANLTITNSSYSLTSTKLSNITVYNSPPVADFNMNKTSGLPPLAVQFTDTSTGANISSWAWDFGEGNTSALQNPEHTFESVGEYQVNLTVTNDGGSSTKLQNITVAYFGAYFIANKTSGSIPLTIQFTDTSVGDYDTWNWSVDDGTLHWYNKTVYADRNLEYTFNNVGSWRVNLSVQNISESGPIYSTSMNITATNIPPVAAFTGYPSAGTTSTTFIFNSTSTGVITSYNWNFGDGNYSATQNTTHVFPSNGIYNVNLTVSNDGGSSYIVHPFTVSAFSVSTSISPTSGVIPLLVTFNETYSGLIPDSYYWEFGDGATSTDKNTTHTYTTIGTFNVNHRIMNGSIISWANTTSAVTALGGSVTANFTANVTAGDYPLYVQFTDTSTYINATPSSWYWTFGDGLTSTSQNPSHTYSNAGKYSVNFTTTTDYGESSKLRSAYISVGGVAANGRQDIILTNTNNIVTLYIKDANSGNLITHAAVSDEMGNELTSYGNGIFSGSYSTGQHTFTANATDYYTNRATYLISGDLIQTIYLTQVATSVSTTWYTPKTIVISFVDAYGNQVRGASVNARFNETTLPNGVSDLISNYGMNVNIANEALNGTLLMSGSTDYQGSIVFTMLSALKYDIAITYNGETNYYSIYPQDSQYQFRFLTTVATDNIWDDLYANGNTKVWATEPDPSNVTFWWSFQDMTSLTTRVDFYLKDVDLDTMVYITNVTSPIAGNIYQLNYTVPNVRGKNYLVWGNYTRDV